MLICAALATGDKAGICEELLSHGGHTWTQAPHYGPKRSELVEAAEDGNERCLVVILNSGADLDFDTWGPLAIGRNFQFGFRFHYRTSRPFLKTSKFLL